MNHYQVLGVRQGANPVEILCAYKALQEAHSQSDFETQIEINIAYQTLIHPGRRSEYDSEIDSTQIRAESSVKLQPAQQIPQQLHLVANHHHVTHQSQTPIHPLTNTFVWFIVSYCLVTVLIVAGLVW